jgi:alpha/beta superfamily hydrolase
MNPADELVIESVRFPSGEYWLEGELVYPESSAARGVMVIAGPHPMLGGDMRNNVVQGVGDDLSERGFVVLRFNYRGVGESQGPPIDVTQHLTQFWKTSHITEEQDFHQDLTAAWAFLEKAIACAWPRIAIGYSFGCSLLPVLCAKHRPDALVLIAPTIGKHNYDSYSSIAQPTLVVAPVDDFASTFSEIAKWREQLTITSQLIATRRDGHFFRGHEAWLSKNIAQFVEGGCDVHG